MTRILILAAALVLLAGCSVSSKVLGDALEGKRADVIVYDENNRVVVKFRCEAAPASKKPVNCVAVKE